MNGNEIIKKSNKTRFSLYEPFIGKLEKAYVNDCLNYNWISSRGKYGKLFEDKFKSFIKISIFKYYNKKR